LPKKTAVLTGVVYVELRGERSYLGLLSVNPELQKTGLGRRLMAAAEEFAREMGSHHMDLTVVNLRTELPPFYRKPRLRGERHGADPPGDGSTGDAALPFHPDDEAAGEWVTGNRTGSGCF